MGFEKEISDVAGIIKDSGKVTIISHIDADGITSEAIMRQAVAREGIEVKSVFVRQLEPLTMKHVPDDNSLKIFIDLGSGQQNLLEERGLSEREVVIIDHHVSQDVDTHYLQANGLPHGHEKLSAAGTGYLVAREINDSNIDLAKLAVIGNVGDMMAREHCGLIGPAREIVDDGVEYGNIEVVKDDLNCYGISTRPLHICLSFADDPHIPGISNRPGEAQNMLAFEAGIQLRKGNGKWKVWEDLDIDERKNIIGRLALKLHSAGEPLDRLRGEHYIFPDERRYTPLRNASEYATMLNACGRWVKPHTGSAVCCGERGDQYREAEHMLRHHRKIIREMMEYILDKGVEECSHLQHIHVGDRFPDTIVGIGAGMALSKLDRRRPIMVLCYLSDDPELVKVSMRTNEMMVQEGLDLQAALLEASEKLGGAGGGHKIAAGAYIPKESEEGFAEDVNRILRKQLS
ncbi:MAG: DHH family phosphoesterase [Methanomicrobiaceae archaeon]|nr:DHH family phosphoesterase [Methanomicrobiaceae archaeon]